MVSPEGMHLHAPCFSGLCHSVSSHKMPCQRACGPLFALRCQNPHATLTIGVATKQLPCFVGAAGAVAECGMAKCGMAKCLAMRAVYPFAPNSKWCGPQLWSAVLCPLWRCSTQSFHCGSSRCPPPPPYAPTASFGSCHANISGLASCTVVSCRQQKSCLSD